MAKLDFDGVSEQRVAGIKRLADSRALLAAGAAHARGAMYLGGYAVECRIKATLMLTHGVLTLPLLAGRLGVDDRDVMTHGLEALLRKSPAFARFQTGPAWVDFATLVNRWRPSWRYDPRDAKPAEAERFLTAVERVVAWLEANG